MKIGEIYFKDLPKRLQDYLEELQGETTIEESKNLQMPVLLRKAEELVLIKDYVLSKLHLFLKTAPIDLVLCCEKKYIIVNGEWQKKSA